MLSVIARVSCFFVCLLVRHKTDALLIAAVVFWWRATPLAGVISSRKGGSSSGKGNVHRPMESSPRRTRKRHCGGACRASLYVCIGRLADDSRDRWFVQVREAEHVGHPMVKCALLQKPSKFLDPDELAIATDVMNAQGSEGVARSLFYFRTGDTVSRKFLFRMKQLQADARLGLRSSPGPADALVKYVRNDPNIDYMLFYDEGNGNQSVTSELGLLGSDVARSQMSVTADQRVVIDDVRAATSLGSCLSTFVHVLVSK